MAADFVFFGICINRDIEGGREKSGVQWECEFGGGVLSESDYFYSTTDPAYHLSLIHI